MKIRTYSSFNMCSIFTTIVIWHETSCKQLYCIWRRISGYQRRKYRFYQWVVDWIL